jgi:tetratricopeptide (TPR) repeat protein
MGVCGLLFYLSVLIAIFLTGFNRLMRKGKSGSDLLMAGLLAGLFGYLIQNLFNFHTVATGFSFWFAIGLMTNLTQKQKPTRVELKSWSYAPSLIKTLLVLCLFALATLGIYQTGLVPFIAHRYAMRSILYNKQNLFDAAESDAKKAIGLMPDVESYYLYLGDVYQHRFEVEKNLRYYTLAAESYEQAVRVNPAERYTRFKLGVYYLKHFEIYGETSSAKRSVSVFKDMIKLEPNHAQSHYNLGVAYYYLKENALALREFKAALRFDPTESDAYFLAGKIYQQEGETAKASNYYQKTIMIDPGNQQARQALKEVRGDR